jgi:hypothetical protein
MLDHYLSANENSTNVLKRIAGYLFFGLYKLAPARVGPWLLRLFFRPGVALQSEQEKDVWAAGNAF